MKKTILAVVLVLISLAVIGLYITDLVINNAEPTKNLFRVVIVVVICVLNLIRLNSRNQRQPLEFYASQFDDILHNAFQGKFYRNKLLCAIRLYHEGNIRKALKYLFDLKDRCETKDDQYAVMLWIALCFTDLQLLDQAEKMYMQMIFKELADSRVYSNLGSIFNRKGDYQRAIDYFNHALEYDRKNYNAYNNIAQAHFQMDKLDEAIPFALKALEINPKMRQASSLLAIIYDLLGDEDQSTHYFHIAINSGYDPEELKEAIAYFRTARQSEAEEKTNS